MPAGSPRMVVEFNACYSLAVGHALLKAQTGVVTRTGSSTVHYLSTPCNHQHPLSPQRTHYSHFEGQSQGKSKPPPPAFILLSNPRQQTCHPKAVCGLCHVWNAIFVFIQWEPYSNFCANSFEFLWILLYLRISGICYGKKLKKWLLKLNQRPHMNIQI